jgi:hypothetical protein
LFSAAIPGQGGTEHINEQPPRYWERQFERHGFHPVDAIRPIIWRDRRVEPWYRQNIFLYASAQAIAASPFLQQEAEKTRTCDMQIVDKDILDQFSHFRGTLRALRSVGVRAVKRRLKRKS